MSVALAGHIGPWTADDVEALPDAGDHARFEVYEGGVLVVSPAPGVGHQRASYPAAPCSGPGGPRRGRYVTRTTLVAGTPGRITRPFAVELNPADLTRRTA
jgi:hypothetical protein